MGNTLGCVRAPKEEYNVDPSKAPLSDQSKDFKGQRKKRKPKSVSSTGTLGNGTDFQDDCTENQPNQEKGSPFRQPRISKDVHVGPVPVQVLTKAGTLPLSSGSAYSPKDLSADQENLESCSSVVERELRDVGQTSRIIPAKDDLEEEKLLRRTVSLKAVEHGLQTLRGNDRTASEEMLSRIACCPYTETIPAKCANRQLKVKQN